MPHNFEQQERTADIVARQLRELDKFERLATRNKIRRDQVYLLSNKHPAFTALTQAFFKAPYVFTDRRPVNSLYLHTELPTAEQKASNPDKYHDNKDVARYLSEFYLHLFAVVELTSISGMFGELGQERLHLAANVYAEALLDNHRDIFDKSVRSLGELHPHRDLELVEHLLARQEEPEFLDNIFHNFSSSPYALAHRLLLTCAKHQANDSEFYTKVYQATISYLLKNTLFGTAVGMDIATATAYLDNDTLDLGTFYAVDDAQLFGNYFKAVFETKLKEHQADLSLYNSIANKFFLSKQSLLEFVNLNRDWVASLVPVEVIGHLADTDKVRKGVHETSQVYLRNEEALVELHELLIQDHLD
ncbi:hypothetical protein CJP74_07540 [Psittacicella melopsittaci]|uniref:Uncharacterized protein n=1 Tax=Psittacicella melopsittaci TaxID=2028576 RepID=A0A3A1Y5N9_9GAMM|nr:hypothetical protein [Psittacicella melopsittaci]RIY31374.1 hypothetical protein CJP74_07540 [Psittacicella melopsittaci]